MEQLTENCLTLQRFSLRCQTYNYQPYCTWAGEITVVRYRNFRMPLPRTCPNCGRNSLRAMPYEGDIVTLGYEDLPILDIFIKMSNFLWQQFEATYPSQPKMKE